AFVTTIQNFYDLSPPQTQILDSPLACLLVYCLLDLHILLGADALFPNLNVKNGPCENLGNLKFGYRSRLELGLEVSC
ncbi:hypothetical protein AVEN_138011-1, partial [Araneus ventricosus]